jgi:mannose-6-phosphate isomerase-like protein (cupin superfamily)
MNVCLIYDHASAKLCYYSVLFHDRLRDAKSSKERAMAKPLVHQPLSGDTLTVAGATITFKVRSDETGSPYSLLDSTLPPHFAGPPPHIHRVIAHTFYVLEGRLQVQLGTEVIQAGVGTSIFVPAGVAHTFANPHTQPTRILQIDSPGEFERYYEELAEAFPSGTPLDRNVMRQIQARYDTYPPE